MMKKSTTTKQLAFTVVITLLVLIIGGLFFFKQLDSNPYHVTVFENGTGWGYQIEAKGKTFIYQPTMPAIEGDNPFPTKEAAEKTGKLVVKKLKKKELPTITQQELNEILKN